MATFTSTLPNSLLDDLNQKANELGLPKKQAD